MNFRIRNIFGAVLVAMLCAAGASAQKITSKSPHSKAHEQLLANQAKNRDQIKLVEKNTFIDLIEDLEPEPDIYTEGWNSKRVNPFKESDVPDTKVIDVTGYCMPVPGKVTSNYGYRAKFGRMHKGIDLAIRSNDTIYAAFDGKVRLTNYGARGYGNYVILRHPNGLETVYGHLNKALVKPDQVVRAGQPIALGGSTGRSTGPHLHFETRYYGQSFDPERLIDFEKGLLCRETFLLKKSFFSIHSKAGQDFEDEIANEEQDKKEAAEKAAQRYHKIRSGDTLGALARKYGTTVNNICRMNGIKSTTVLRIGRTLRVR